MQTNQEEKNIVDEQKSGSEVSPEQEIENTEGLPDAEQQEADPLAKIELELSEAKDKYLRLYSDFDNYKKRINRERIDLIKSAGADLILSFLPIIDDFERAIKIAPLPDGIDLIYNKLINIFSQKGVKVMEAIGQPFDADLHDAIANVPAPDEKQKGKVVDEIEKGYYLNDKVIRHAKVIVGN